MRDLFFYCLGLFTLPGLLALLCVALVFKAARVGIRRQKAETAEQEFVRLREVIRGKRADLQ